MKLSKYPKKRLSLYQIRDEEKLKKERKKNKILQKCDYCRNETFFIDTLGIEHCSKCLSPINFIL